jgi:hypothetical protein
MINPGEEADRASTERHPSVPIWEQKGEDSRGRHLDQSRDSKVRDVSNRSGLSDAPKPGSESRPAQIGPIL